MASMETRVTQVTRIGRMVVPRVACLVQIYGPELGRRWEIAEGEALVVGREPTSGLVVDLDTVSRHHCRIEAREGRVFLVDLKSTNGTYVNDTEAAGEVTLAPGDKVTVGGAIFKFLAEDDVEQLYYEEIYRTIIFDGLTQTYNKRFLMEFLDREMARSARWGRALSLLMLDIDNFKRVNDAHGHLAGDRVLQELTAVLRTCVRREECLARFGGEEFAMVLPESGPDKARVLADKLVRLVAEHAFVFEGERIPVTISIGLAYLRPEMVEPAQFLKAADEQLYRAKREGRNRVCG